MTTKPDTDPAASLRQALEYYVNATVVTSWGMQEEAGDGEMARYALNNSLPTLLSRLDRAESEVKRLRDMLAYVQYKAEKGHIYDLEEYAITIAQALAAADASGSESGLATE